jgi:hypothetical protein
MGQVAGAALDSVGACLWDASTPQARPVLARRVYLVNSDFKSSNTAATINGTTHNAINALNFCRLFSSRRYGLPNLNSMLGHIESSHERIEKANGRLQSQHQNNTTDQGPKVFTRRAYPQRAEPGLGAGRLPMMPGQVRKVISTVIPIMQSTMFPTPRAMRLRRSMRCLFHQNDCGGTFPNASSRAVLFAFT